MSLPLFTEDLGPNVRICYTKPLKQVDVWLDKDSVDHQSSTAKILDIIKRGNFTRPVSKVLLHAPQTLDHHEGLEFVGAGRKGYNLYSIRFPKSKQEEGHRSYSFVLTPGATFESFKISAAQVLWMPGVQVSVETAVDSNFSPQSFENLGLSFRAQDEHGVQYYDNFTQYPPEVKCEEITDWAFANKVLFLGPRVSLEELSPDQLPRCLLTVAERVVVPFQNVCFGRTLFQSGFDSMDENLDIEAFLKSQTGLKTYEDLKQRLMELYGVVRFGLPVYLKVANQDAVILQNASRGMRLSVDGIRMLASTVKPWSGLDLYLPRHIPVPEELSEELGITKERQEWSISRRSRPPCPKFLTRGVNMFVRPDVTKKELDSILRQRDMTPMQLFTHGRESIKSGINVSLREPPHNFELRRAGTLRWVLDTRADTHWEKDVPFIKRMFQGDDASIMNWERSDRSDPSDLSTVLVTTDPDSAADLQLLLKDTVSELKSSTIKLCCRRKPDEVCSKLLSEYGFEKQSEQGKIGFVRRPFTGDQGSAPEPHSEPEEKYEKRVVRGPLTGVKGSRRLVLDQIGEILILLPSPDSAKLEETLKEYWLSGDRIRYFFRAGRLKPEHFNILEKYFCKLVSTHEIISNVTGCCQEADEFWKQECNNDNYCPAFEYTFDDADIMLMVMNTTRSTTLFCFSTGWNAEDFRDCPWKRVARNAERLLDELTSAGKLNMTPSGYSVVPTSTDFAIAMQEHPQLPWDDVDFVKGQICEHLPCREIERLTHEAREQMQILSIRDIPVLPGAKGISIRDWNTHIDISVTQYVTKEDFRALLAAIDSCTRRGQVRLFLNVHHELEKELKPDKYVRDATVSPASAEAPLYTSAYRYSVSPNDWIVSFLRGRYNLGVDLFVSPDLGDIPDAESILRTATTPASSSSAVPYPDMRVFVCTESAANTLKDRLGFTHSTEDPPSEYALPFSNVDAKWQCYRRDPRACILSNGIVLLPGLTFVTVRPDVRTDKTVARIFIDESAKPESLAQIFKIASTKQPDFQVLEVMLPSKHPEFAIWSEMMNSKGFEAVASWCARIEGSLFRKDLKGNCDATVKNQDPGLYLAKGMRVVEMPTDSGGVFYRLFIEPGSSPSNIRVMCNIPQPHAERIQVMVPEEHASYRQWCDDLESLGFKVVSDYCVDGAKNIKGWLYEAAGPCVGRLSKAPVYALGPKTNLFSAGLDFWELEGGIGRIFVKPDANPDKESPVIEKVLGTQQPDCPLVQVALPTDHVHFLKWTNRLSALGFCTIKSNLSQSVLFERKVEQSTSVSFTADAASTSVSFTAHPILAPNMHLPEGMEFVKMGARRLARILVKETVDSSEVLYILTIIRTPQPDYDWLQVLVSEENPRHAICCMHLEILGKFKRGGSLVMENSNGLQTLGTLLERKCVGTNESEKSKSEPNECDPSESEPTSRKFQLDPYPYLDFSDEEQKVAGAPLKMGLVDFPNDVTQRELTEFLQALPSDRAFDIARISITNNHSDFQELEKILTQHGFKHVGTFIGARSGPLSLFQKVLERQVQGPQVTKEKEVIMF